MKFKVGDKIAGYDSNARYVGVIEKIDKEGTLRVKHGIGIDFFHPKQCRKLKKKEPRKRIWIQFDEVGLLDSYEFITSKHAPIPEDAIEFIEVRKKKVK